MGCWDLGNQKWDRSQHSEGPPLPLPHTPLHRHSSHIFSALLVPLTKLLPTILGFFHFIAEIFFLWTHPYVPHFVACSLISQLLVVPSGGASLIPLFCSFPHHSHLVTPWLSLSHSCQSHSLWPSLVTHVSQQPTPTGCRQVQWKQSLRSQDSPRLKYFPS